MSLISDVGALLTSVSNIYYGYMPATPDNVVGIFHSGGYARSLTGTEVEEPTFKIIVRDTVYTTGIGICETIKDALNAANNSGNFLLIQQESDVLDLGLDENNRHEWSLNFRALYRRT